MKDGEAYTHLKPCMYMCRGRKDLIKSVCGVCVDSRWNFSVGNFELKFLPETQSGRNFLEGELSNGANSHRESQRIIREEDWQEVEQQRQKQQQQLLDLVIKVSVPDWKVMAFSTGPEARLVWEHQVNSSF